jgi:hypothetical protein
MYSINLAQSLRELNSKLPQSIREKLKDKLGAWVQEDNAKRKLYASALDS